MSDFFNQSPQTTERYKAHLWSGYISRKPVKDLTLHVGDIDVLECQSLKKGIPLAVDLDGTLIASDLLWESLFVLFGKNILYIFIVPFWLLKGKAYLKTAIAARVTIDATHLPYRQDFLNFLKNCHADGQKIILATASAQKFADAVAEHLGIFDKVFATDINRNLSSHRKASLLRELYGDKGFDYAGNSRDDLAVFAVANQAIIVAPDRSAAKYQKKHMTQLFAAPAPTPIIFLKMIRVHQWLKNILVFVPVILAHEFLNGAIFMASIAAFFAYSTAASAIYIVNDLIDLPSDRQHLKKRNRPLASGMVSIPFGLATSVSLLLVSALICLTLPLEFSLVLGIYIVTTFAYSLFIKRKMLVDVLCLAGLYSLRLLGGMAAAGIEQSFWLMAFSMFFFLSLALVKRYVELANSTLMIKNKLAGRGYCPEDRDIVGQSGVASAFTAALVLALYINNDQILTRYDYPWMLWPLGPIVLYLNLRIWILAHRGEMDEDPVVFLATDWRSQLVISIGMLCFIIAGIH